jgi:hypothetical protein
MKPKGWPPWQNNKLSATLARQYFAAQKLARECVRKKYKGY